MPKSTGESDQARSWNLSMFWVFTGAVIVFHLFAVFVVLPLYNNGGNRSNFPFPASSCSGNEQRTETSVLKEDEISVSSTSGSIPISMDSVINLDQ